MEYAVTKYSQKYHLFVLVRENRNIPAKVYVVNSNGKVLNKKPLYYHALLIILCLILRMEIHLVAFLKYKVSLLVIMCI
jgi:hypothetical protein